MTMCNYSGCSSRGDTGSKRRWRHIISSVSAWHLSNSIAPWPLGWSGSRTCLHYSAWLPPTRRAVAGFSLACHSFRHSRLETRFQGPRLNDFRSLSLLLLHPFPAPLSKLLHGRCLEPGYVGSIKNPRSHTEALIPQALAPFCSDRTGIVYCL